VTFTFTACKEFAVYVKQQVIKIILNTSWLPSTRVFGTKHGCDLSALDHCIHLIQTMRATPYQNNCIISNTNLFVRKALLFSCHNKYNLRLHTLRRRSTCSWHDNFESVIKHLTISHIPEWQNVNMHIQTPECNFSPLSYKFSCNLLVL